MMGAIHDRCPIAALEDLPDHVLPLAHYNLIGVGQGFLGQRRGMAASHDHPFVGELPLDGVGDAVGALHGMGDRRDADHLRPAQPGVQRSREIVVDRGQVLLEDSYLVPGLPQDPAQEEITEKGKLSEEEVHVKLRVRLHQGDSHCSLRNTFPSRGSCTGPSKANDSAAVPELHLRGVSRLSSRRGAPM
jgi:hypothetical protein